jgi:hypothetical protein
MLLTNELLTTSLVALLYKMVKGHCVYVAYSELIIKN